MENLTLNATYRRYGSQEKLVSCKNDDAFENNFDEEEDDEEEEEANLKELEENGESEFVQVPINPKRICFVTDASLSSWSDPGKHWEKTTCLRYVCKIHSQAVQNMHNQRSTCVSFHCEYNYVLLYELFTSDLLLKFLCTCTAPCFLKLLSLFRVVRDLIYFNTFLKSFF